MRQKCSINLRSHAISLFKVMNHHSTSSVFITAKYDQFDLLLTLEVSSG